MKLPFGKKKKETFQCDCCKRIFPGEHFGGVVIGFNVLGREVFSGVFCGFCRYRCGLREAQEFNKDAQPGTLINGIDKMGNTYVDWDRIQQIMNEEEEAAIQGGRWIPSETEKP